MSSPKLLYTLDQPHGMGELYFVWQKGESRTLLATTGNDASVAVYDRSGHLLERIKLPGLCAGMEWDNDGDILAIISPNSNTIQLWECHTNKRHNIETGLREPPSCLAWAYGEPLLAVGTQKGNLALYNHHTTKRIPIIGKHTKKITTAAWNKDSILVLASEDKTLSINNSEGDTLRIISLRDMPNDVQFSEMKMDERVSGENTISLVVGKRTLYLYNLLNPENPIELAFQQRYGSIVSYKWYADGYILIGFSAGYVISISTHIKEVGEELFQVKNHKDVLTSVDVYGGQAASCGDGQLKVISIWENGEVTSSCTPAGGAERLSWSSDGQLLAVSGRGYLSVYVTSLPPLYAVCGTRLAALTSLTEAAVYNPLNGDLPGSAGEITAEAVYVSPMEPTLLALGTAHICFVRDSLACFCPLNGRAMIKRQYPAPVEAMVLANDYAAVKFNGKAMLHMIEEPESGPEFSMMFPEPHMASARITDIHLTPDFFIFVTDHGHIEYIDLESRSVCSRHVHSAPIVRVFCDIAGTRAALLGAARCEVYSAATHDTLLVQDVPPGEIKHMIWEVCLTSRNVVVAWCESGAYTLWYGAAGAGGGAARPVAAPARLRPAAHPLLLCEGELYCGEGGKIIKLSLESQAVESGGGGGGGGGGGPGEAAAEEPARRAALLAVAARLRRWPDVWAHCLALDRRDLWEEAGRAAIEDLNVEFAIRVYTRLNDVAMVWALQDVAHIEDISLLCAHLSACLGRGEAASAWAARACRAGAGSEAGGGRGGGRGRAGRAAAALLAARGLWREAAAADEDANTDITFAHARHLELTADYHESLAEYEKSLINENVDDPEIKKHNAKCYAGIARTSIRCGDVMKGVSISLKQADLQLMKQCAELLEEEKHYTHAATLYENIGNLEKAAALYIKLKSWLKIESLLPKINSPSIHIQYAKCKEAEGRYNDAVKSYLRAQDFEAAIRLYLEKLDDIDEAVSLVQETKSVPGAKMVANYFQRSDDPTSAIKFLVMSLCYEEAFQLARKYGKLDLYGDILIQTSQARPEDFKSLAVHFEGEKNYLLSGKFYFHAGQYNKAMNHLLKVRGSEEEENEAIVVAIDTAAACDDDRLTKRLIEFLLGENDGNPRDPKHLFRLYMAKKQFDEAAKTAVIISGAEVCAGRYREARAALRALPAARTAHRRALHTLHSYILVRSHVRRGRHELAALLLDRIADDVAFFPLQQHQVSILTSAVIECGRAGMKQRAHHWAKVLMQPQYRPLIEEKYVKRVESAVRHAPRGGEVGAGGAGAGAGPGGAGAGPGGAGAGPGECPVCGAAGPRAALLCAACQAPLPMCIATGLRIIRDELTACPECDFPANITEFVELLKEEGKCPMCDENVDYRRLHKIEDPTPYLDLNATSTQL